MTSWVEQFRAVRKLRRAATVLAAAILCAIFGAGCRPTKAPMGAEYHIGDPAPAGPLTFNVIETRWASQLESFPTPRIPDHRFLLVRVTITNGGGAEAGVPFLKLVNANGDMFGESENGAGVDRWLGLIRRINPAQTEDGWVLFDVPTNSYKLRVSDGAPENEHIALIGIPLSVDSDPQLEPRM